MSTIDGGHYQPQIPPVRAASADGYADFEFSRSERQYGLDEFLELEFEAFASLQGDDLVTSPAIERAIKALESVVVN